MKSRINIFTIIFLVLGFLTTSHLDAQKKDTLTKKESVIVIGNYNPTIVKFKKPAFSPVLKDSGIVRQKVDYMIFPQPLQSSLVLKPIKAAKITGEAFDPLTSNYIKAGFGNYITPYFELWLSNKRNKDFSTVLQLKHLSSTGKIKDYSFPGHSENLAAWSGNRYFSKYTLGSNVSYRRNAVHYYGFKPEEWVDSSLTKDNTKQVYQRIAAGIDFERTNIDKKAFQHQYHLNFNHLWALNDVSENEIAFNTSMYKNVAWVPVSKNQRISLDASYAHFFEKNAIRSFNGGLFSLQPKYRFMFDVVNLDLGIDLSARTDSAAEAYILPMIRMELNLFPGILSLYGEFTGRAKYNSIDKLSENNPFINAFVNPNYSVERKHLSAGLNGSMFRSFTYQIGAEYVSTDDMPLFVPDTITTFEHTYTTILSNVDIFNLKFDGNLSLSKKWSSSISFVYHHAEAENQEYAWHIPQFDGQFRLNYNLDDKILVELGVFALGKRFAPSYLNDTLEIKTLKPVFDFNLGLEYRYSKNLSAFLKFNNLSATRYYAWTNYPNYRFSFLAGLTYNF